ncbi:hypothetical protein TWF506_004490 [Arthrobotrys conoides]|uniref:Uncharacterized protein n=1 Tax=Arthrobotrys conoides TaxID=74498 RepID=A0AAN8RTK4_9PEZI
MEIPPEYFTSELREENLLPLLRTENLSGLGVFKELRLEIRGAYKILLQDWVEPRGYSWGDLPPEHQENALKYIIEHTKYPDIVRANPWLPQKLLEQYMKSRKDLIRGKSKVSSSTDDRAPLEGSNEGQIEERRSSVSREARNAGWFDPVRDRTVDTASGLHDEEAYMRN